MEQFADARQSLAAAITKKASKQTYYTIRFFVDRQRAEDAYRAYGYFRWVDDVLDEGAGTTAEMLAFIHRQQELLENLYRGDKPLVDCIEEQMLVDLVRHDNDPESGLQAYLRNMMAVMAFDASRRERMISQAELSEYSRMLATAVTEAMYYFIGHDDPSPHDEARYLAVSAAHITHMLRDTFEDTAAGYFNIPREYLEKHSISARDLESQAYRRWVCSRVQLARQYFMAGRESIARVKNLRCRLAGYAYLARFEWVLRAIEVDRFCLRSAYPERKSLGASLWMGWSTLASVFASLRIKTRSQDLGPIAGAESGER